MIPNLLLEKLRSVETRYEDLNSQLAEPAIVSDSKKYQKLAKTHSDLGEIVHKYREFLDLEKGIGETRVMVNEGDADPDMKKMEEEELSALESRLEKCEVDLKFLLLPRDPND